MERLVDEPSQVTGFGCRSVSVGLIFPLFMSVVWICRLKLATHQASFNVFCYVLLRVRPVCHLLECFIGGLDPVVSCAWCIVCVCQHHPPLAMRYYELWRSEWLGDVRTSSLRCSMCLTEWSVRSSEDVFRSVEEMSGSNGLDM